GAALTEFTKTKHPVTPGADAEISNSPGESVLLIVSVTTPLFGVTAPVAGVTVPMLGVLFETWTIGVLAFATVFPFTSFSVTLSVDVPPVAPLFAMTVVGFALHTSADGWP